MTAVELLAQRSLASRPRPAYASLSQGPATPGSPHTPLLGRSFSSSYGSPGSNRIEDEHVVYEVGSRYVRAGFVGEALPKVVWKFGPEQHDRSGNYAHTPSLHVTTAHASDHELWDYDVNSLDLDLVHHKLERAFRTINGKHLLVDLRNRTAILSLNPGLPDPLIETVLDTLFSAVNAPKNAFLVTSPLMASVAAGLRSALVIDIGWLETTVTAIFEHRMISQRRSIRASRMLHFHTKRLCRSLFPTGAKLSFSDVEDFSRRYLHCLKSGQPSQDETDPNAHVQIRANGSNGPSRSIPISKLSEPVETTFLKDRQSSRTDDHDATLPDLTWRALLALPVDVRSSCIARLIIVGGGSGIPGLSTRLVQEVQCIVNDRGWDPVNISATLRTARDNSARCRTLPPIQRQLVPIVEESNSNAIDQQPASDDGDGVVIQERDEITEKLEREAAKGRPPEVEAVPRAVKSLGSWAGASLMGHLRVDGSVEVKREEFLKSGMHVLGYPQL